MESYTLAEALRMKQHFYAEYMYEEAADRGYNAAASRKAWDQYQLWAKRAEALEPQAA